jgi:hypothetical protein
LRWAPGVGEHFPEGFLVFIIRQTYCIHLLIN